MLNVILVLIGWFLCIPAIALGPIVKLLPLQTNRPWVDGVLLNTLRAYKKYNARSWIRRMISIYQNPSLTVQYLKLLANSEKISQSPKKVMMAVSALSPGHDVQISHAHHRNRVSALKSGKIVSSDFGPMVVVNGTVHDGNHRLAAAREAGVTHVEVLQYLAAKETTEESASCTINI